MATSSKSEKDTTGGNSEKKPTSSKAEKKPSLIEEFKAFIARGNVLELAVGLTVGTAFTRLVNSLVNNLIMPVVGLALSGESFRSLFVNLGPETFTTLAEAEAAGAPIIKYGQLIADLLDFFIIAVVIFFVVKLLQRMQKHTEQLELDL